MAQQLFRLLPLAGDAKAPEGVQRYVLYVVSCRKPQRQSPRKEPDTDRSREAFTTAVWQRLCSAGNDVDFMALSSPSTITINNQRRPGPAAGLAVAFSRGTLALL